VRIMHSDAFVSLGLSSFFSMASRLSPSVARPAAPPVAAVRALMDFMDLGSPSIGPLKRRLDLLAKMAGERGLKRNAVKHLYLNPQVSASGRIRTMAGIVRKCAADL